MGAAASHTDSLLSLEGITLGVLSCSCGSDLAKVKSTHNHVHILFSCRYQVQQQQVAVVGLETSGWRIHKTSTCWLFTYSSSVPGHLLLIHRHDALCTAAVESPERRCFCIDVTCDNLLDAVKQTVEEETARLIKRRDAELTINLREAIFEEQQLAAKAGRFECERPATAGAPGRG